MTQESSDKKGYVYILMNPAFSGFLKVGKTTKEPDARARELSSVSGVPAPYSVAWGAFVNDCDCVEKLIHQQLSHARSRKDREFFAIPLKDAISIVSRIVAPFSCGLDTDLQNVPPTIRESSETNTFKSALALFHDQTKQFIEKLKERESDIWLPSLRGNFKEDKPSNWFICFVPTVWGRCETNYGVHFDLIYTRAKDEHQEDYFRLTIGVENPLKEQYKQSFKKEVISKIETKAISCSGFTLSDQNRKKLLEVAPIPISSESWRIILDKYIFLRPVVNIIGEVIREYSDQGKFDCVIKFRNNL